MPVPVNFSGLYIVVIPDGAGGYVIRRAMVKYEKVSANSVITFAVTYDNVEADAIAVFEDSDAGRLEAQDAVLVLLD
jgi:hypothetical protein